MSANSERQMTNVPGSGDQPMEDVAVRNGAPQPMDMGPKGKGTSGFRVPGPETLHKREPADEKSPKAVGPETEGGLDSMTLGALTEEDRGLEAGPRKEEVVDQAKPVGAERQRYAPEREIGQRIPETERADEAATGLGKGVGIAPGSVGRETGQTP